MTFYYLTSPSVTIGLVSDEGSAYNKVNDRGYRCWHRKITDAPPYAAWAIGKETYHVLRWFRARGFKVKSKKARNAL